MLRIARTFITVATLGAALLTPTAASANDYSNAEYRDRDQKNMRDSYGRVSGQFNLDWFSAWATETANHYPDNVVEAAQDPLHVQAGLGMVPSWDTTNPDYWDEYRARLAAGRVQPVRFRSSTGAVLRGHVWRPAEPGTYPMIELTPGSVQATENSYWWAGFYLSDRGYIVLTFDAQGQGKSGTFGNTDLGLIDIPNPDGVPSQQDVNFLHATVDAIDFSVSTPSAHHSLAFAADGPNGIDRFNPFHAQVEWLADGYVNLGIVGHSFGARGVSYAQDPARNTRNQKHVRAVVAWDNLEATYTPSVPAMAHTAESFVFPSFNYSRPNPEGKKGAFNKWRAAGVDTMLVSPRAATHMEWSYQPPASASTWGNAIGAFYTAAWFDRYLTDAPDADARLLHPMLNHAPNVCGSGNTDCSSIYLKSAYAFRDRGGVLRACDDVAHIANAAPCPDTDQ